MKAKSKQTVKTMTGKDGKAPNGALTSILIDAVRYHPTEGRKLSRPRWLVIHPDGLTARKQSPIQVVALRP